MIPRVSRANQQGAAFSACAELAISRHRRYAWRERRRCAVLEPLLHECLAMFYGITDITTFVLGTIFIVLLPGPNSMYVMSVASRCGVSAGYRAALGVFCGDLVLMTLAATGVASLLKATPVLFFVLKYAGAAYLIYLGIGLVRAAWRQWRMHGAAADEETDAPPQAARPFRVALTISLMNPKAILFFVSFFIQFVAPDSALPVLSFAILGSVVQCFSMLYLSLLIFGGNYLADLFRRRRRLSSGATGGVGALFVGFGIKLSTATLG